MMQEKTFLEKLVTRLEEKGFTRKSGSEKFWYEKAHPLEPILKTFVVSNVEDNGVGYSDLFAIASTILFAKYRDYTISNSVRVTPYLNEDVFLEKIVEALDMAYQKGCQWYDKRNGTKTASGEVVVPKTGGYQKMECPKTPLDGI